MKKIRVGLLLFLFAFISAASFGQVTTLQSGDWNDPNTWDCGCTPDFNSGPITILAGNAVSVPSAFTADADEITVAGDGILTIENGGRLIVRSSGGTDLTIEEADFITTFSDGLLTVDAGGVLENRSIISSNSSNLVVNGEYEHNRNGGDIPFANWISGSTVRVTGITSNAIAGGLGQNFYNFIWNCPTQSSIAMLNNGLSSIGGDFTVSNTNNQFLMLGSTVAGSGSTTINGNLSVINSTSKFYISAIANYTLNVNGNVLVESAASNFPFLGTANGTVVLNVGGDVSFTSPQPSRFVAGTGGFTLNNTGSLSFTNSTLQFSSSSGSSTINLTGNLTLNNSILTETSTGTGTINFVGSGTHIFSRTGGSITNTINVTNAVGSTLDLGTSILEGGGAFTNNGTLRVGSTHASGALQSTTNLTADCGNIIMGGTRTYANPSTIVYNGSAPQFIGDGHPTSPGVAITIANSSGVSIAIPAPVTFAGAVNLESGNLNVNNSSLTITGSITGPNNITVGSAGSITLGGSANVGTFPFPAGPQSFTNFTLNNSNGITFNNDVTLTGELTLESGALRFNDRTLNLDGTLSVTSGSLSSNSASTLNITGEGAFGSSLNFASGGNTIGTLVVDRTVSGVVELNSTLTIANSLILENGQFQNTTGLTMANGSTITRRGGSLTVDNPDIVSGSYNVTYNPGSSINTSLELPIGATQLNNLTISGPTVLTQNVTVNGNVSLTSGTFTAGSNTITMQGSTWSRSGGSFIPGTGLVTFNGVTSITSTSGSPQFGRIRVESGRTLNFPSTTVNLSGNITFIAGSTVNSNGGTVLLNGGGDQNFGGGGTTLNNITVTKSGGSILLTSTLNITGVLNVTSATIFSSANNLTLISTSDGTTGNASIASLAGGGLVTGDVTVQRYLSAEPRFWRYLSSPVQNATVASWKDDFPITGTFSDPSTSGEWPGLPPLSSANPSLYRYVETVAGLLDLGWEAFPASGLASENALEPGRGYSTFIRNTTATVIDVTGPINSGNVSLPVTLTGSPSADNGWNLVGNPYPSSIDWDHESWTKSNVSNSIQIRDDPSGIFQTWNGSIGSLGGGEIAMGQAFWVQASGSSPNLQATELVKTSNTGSYYRMEEEPVTDAFEIVLAKGNDVDYTYVWFNEDATDGYDPKYDVAKFNNDIFDLSSLTKDNNKMAINTQDYLSCGEVLRLDVSTSKESYDLKGSYSFTFNAIGTTDPELNMVLFDSFTETSVTIQNGTLYSFEVTEDENTFGSTRFTIVLQSDSPEFGIEEVFGGTSCNAGTAVLSAKGAPEGGIYKWYESEIGGTVLYESADPNFTTPVINQSSTYYVSTANEYGCESDRVAVEAQVVQFEEISIEKEGNTLISNYAEGNQWYIDNEPITGATSQEFEPNESGTYAVEVNVEGCISRTDYDFVITDVEKEFAAEWSYYPNPVSHQLVLKTSYPVNQIRKIGVMNSLGVEIGEIKVNADGVGYFDMESKPSGIYVIKILGSGKSVNFKVIKQ